MRRSKFLTSFIDKELAKNIFPYKDVYDDEYFEFLYYFNYKYFVKIISKFSKKGDEKSLEMNSLRNILMEIEKVNDKFYKMKFVLGYLNKDNISVLASGVNVINHTFAHVENKLVQEQNKEINDKIIQKARKNQMNQSKFAYDKPKSAVKL